MRLLFEIDHKDYADCKSRYVRNSARSIIIKDKKVAMMHSSRFDNYKFPGGGIEGPENPVEAMIRETREEAGLIVIPESIREYGYVHRIQKGEKDPAVCFVQDNFYFLCSVQDEVVPQCLDDYEAQENFTLEFVDPKTAITKNRNAVGDASNQLVGHARDARILELLIAEGFFD